MATVYLALGSNVGDSESYIEQAIAALSPALNNIVRAPLYRSKAAGYTDQADFLNTAIRGETALNPEELLSFIQSAEKALGRQKRFRWGPREIDIDIIFYGNQQLRTEGLSLPHPLFRERDFVLRPLADLNPELIDPESSLSVTALLAQISPADRTISESV